MRTVAALALLCARAAAETCFDGAPYAHFWRFFDEDVFPGLSSPTRWTGRDGGIVPLLEPLLLQQPANATAEPSSRLFPWHDRFSPFGRRCVVDDDLYSRREERRLLASPQLQARLAVALGALAVAYYARDLIEFAPLQYAAGVSFGMTMLTVLVLFSGAWFVSNRLGRGATRLGGWALVATSSAGTFAAFVWEQGRATLAAYKRCALGYVALAFVASLALTHYRLASWKAAGDGRHALSRQLVDVLCWSARAGAFAVAYLASPSALYGLALGPLVFALPRLLELNAALHERLVERTMLRRPDRNYLRGHRYMTMEQYERFGEQTTRAELANLYNSPEFQRHVARKAQSGYRIEFVPFGQHTPRTPGEHGAADCDEDSDE